MLIFVSLSFLLQYVLVLIFICVLVCLGWRRYRKLLAGVDRLIDLNYKKENDTLYCQIINADDIGTLKKLQKDWNELYDEMLSRRSGNKELIQELELVHDALVQRMIDMYEKELDEYEARCNYPLKSV